MISGVAYVGCCSQVYQDGSIGLNELLNDLAASRSHGSVGHGSQRPSHDGLEVDGTGGRRTGSIEVQASDSAVGQAALQFFSQINGGKSLFST